MSACNNNLNLPNINNGTISYSINDTINVSYNTSSSFVYRSGDCNGHGYTASKYAGQNLLFSIYTNDINTNTIYCDTTLDTICNKKQVFVQVTHNNIAYYSKSFMNATYNNNIIKFNDINNGVCSGIVNARLWTVNGSDSINIKLSFDNLNFLEY